MKYVTVSPLKGYYFSFTLDTNDGYNTSDTDKIRNYFTSKLTCSSILPDLESSYLIRTEDNIDDLSSQIRDKIKEIACFLEKSEESYKLSITLIEITDPANIKSSKFNKKQFNEWCKSGSIKINELFIE